MTQPEDDLLDKVIRVAIFAADNAVTEASPFRTRAEETRAAVTAAFQLAVGNGIIQLVPLDQWPKYVALSPPYDPSAIPENTPRP